MRKKNVVIGYLGTQLDAGGGRGRWQKWRPTVSLVQQAAWPLDRLELFCASRYQSLAERVLADIAELSPATQVKLVPMEVSDPWDFGEVYAGLYDWARSYPFDSAREDYRVHITTGTHVAQICLFLLVEARFIPGVLLQTSPPRRQNGQQPGSLTLIDLDLSRYDALAQRFRQARHEARAHLKSGIATRNARFNALIDEIERVAVRSRAPILLAGPTGAGKSHLARRMYELKKARHQVQGAFVEVNCATLRGDGAASTLFGHKRGAFTGAAADRAGLLRSADGGVLFLDEIGELGLDEQAMLLKAVEEKRFYPMGSDQEVESDFQLIAGTHRDLRADVAAGRFREDLFARINLWTYHLPGLAERPEDIAPNIDHLLARHASEDGRLARFSSEARARYLAFAQSPRAPWRGNFRDLAASITRLATLAEGGRIGSALVEAEIARLEWLWHGAAATNATTPTADMADREAAGHHLSAARPAASSATTAAIAHPAATSRASTGHGGAGHQAEDAVEAAQAVDALLHPLLGPERLAALDLFDRLQLRAVIALCQRSASLADAGRQLFNHSRTRRSAINDSDRLRKYLARFGLSWTTIQTRPAED